MSIQEMYKVIRNKNNPDTKTKAASGRSSKQNQITFSIFVYTRVRQPFWLFWIPIRILL